MIGLIGNNGIQVDAIILDGVDLTTTLNTKLTADGIGKITESITEPVAPAVGDVWIDIS